jgi:hypothetical protein
MYSKHCLCLIPQHGAGRKHCRKIALESWQQKIVARSREAFIRCLIHSDGCQIVACERQAGRVRYAPRYTFSNKSEDIKGLFCESCDALGIRWTRPTAKEVAIYRRDTVGMDKFIGQSLDSYSTVAIEPSHSDRPVCKVRRWPNTGP